jgi:hypothetical protein
MLQTQPSLGAATFPVTGAANSPPTPLSFSIQNCNSLNLTGTTGNFDSKLTAIVMAKSDVILLSLRDSCIKKYNILFNSSLNSRGTAILLAADMDYMVNMEYKDTGENYYILDISINGSRYCIGSVYGPNNTCRDFYRNLNALMRS